MSLAGFNPMSRCVAPLAVVVTLLASSRGADVEPKDSAPRDRFVTVSHTGACWVMGVAKDDTTGSCRFIDVKATTFDLKTGGKITVWNGSPGSYLIYGAESGGTQFQFTYEIKDDGPPTPPIPPDPDPDEPDDPPSPSLGLAVVARDAASKIGNKGRHLIPEIAANFRATASAVAAGGIKTRQDAYLTIQGKNRKTLGDLVSTWTVWLYDVGDAVDALEDGGHLGTVKQYGTALDEIAEGLESVAR